MDAYRVLGVERGASDRDIRVAYRRLAREYHPDRYAMSQTEIRVQAQQRMAEINIAFGVLTDPEAARRQEHSEIRRDAAMAKRRSTPRSTGDHGTVFATSADTPGSAATPRPTPPPPTPPPGPATSTTAAGNAFNYRRDASSEFDVPPAPSDADDSSDSSDGALFTMQKKPRGGLFRRR